MTVMSELFWVTNATTACGSIPRFLMRATISCCTSAGVFPAASYRAICNRVGREAADEIKSAVARIRMPASINGSLAGTAQLFQQSLGMEPF
jgi:multidrug efflux pump